MAQLDLNRLTDKLDSTKSISPEDRSFLKESIVRAHSSMANEQTVQLQFAKEEISSPTQLERQLSY